MKRIVLLFATLIMCIGFSVTAFAEEIPDNNDYSHELIGLEGNEKTSRWTYTKSTSQGLNINSGTATYSASVTGYSNATKIVMYMYLQQSTDSGWTNIASHTHTFNKSYGSASHTHSAPSGHNYRLRCSYYVYCGSDYEHIIAYSAIK